MGAAAFADRKRAPTRDPALRNRSRSADDGDPFSVPASWNGARRPRLFDRSPEPAPTCCERCRSVPRWDLVRRRHARTGWSWQQLLVDRRPPAPSLRPAALSPVVGARDSADVSRLVTFPGYCKQKTVCTWTESTNLGKITKKGDPSLQMVTPWRVEPPSLVRRGFYAIIQQFRDSFGLFLFNIQSQKYLTQKILDQFVSNLQVRCICTRRTIVYNMIAKDQAQRMLLRATKQLAEAKLLGKSRCEPRTATARWTGVRLVMVMAVVDTGWFGGEDAMSIFNEPNASQDHNA